ncbi:MAG: hypothetical protein AB1921_11560 [Thermodesulfobacteriota bacterium]
MKIKGSRAAKILCAFVCLAFFAAGVPGAAFAKVVAKAPGAASVSPDLAQKAQADQAELSTMRAGAKPAGYWTTVFFVTAAVLILVLVGNGR